MEDAILAFCVALDYAKEQMQWYQDSADNKLLLFRGLGITALLSTVLVTYFSATLSEENSNFWRFKRKNVTAFLAAVGTISVAVSGFFGWKSSWEGHRTAELEIKAMIVEAEITKLKIGADGNPDEMYKLAEELSADVRKLVLTETSGFFKSLTDANATPPNGS